MINTKTKTQTKTINEVISVTCDKCKREIYKDDIIEFQEVIQIHHNCGYGSIFGDENIIHAEFCQSCASELFRQYLRIEENEI